MTVDYLLINPVKGSPHVHSALGSTVDHWTKRRGALEIGHRGMGNSYRKDRKEYVCVLCTFTISHA